MALTLPGSTSNVVSIQEYIEYIHANVDLRDMDSVAASAPMLRALANDRELVVRQLNKQVKNSFKADAVPSAQAIFLGKGEDFFVRANIWPSSADVTAGRVYQDQFSYNLAHDHNYSFMTVGYLGPGYVTEIYEYDNDQLEGYVGEPVNMRFMERTLFSTSMVMLYYASRDLHIQYPPEDLSITLNLMISTPEVRIRDQYFFDLEKKVLTGFSPDSDGSRRVSMIGLAGYVGDGETQQLLTDLARHYPCRRTRLMAFESLCRLNPADAAKVWEQACDDPAPLVANTARRKLKELAG